MLRITTNESQQTLRLIVEGKLSGDWVVELESYCGAVKTELGLRSLAIDLRNLIDADTAGRDLLLRLQQQGTVLENVHPLLASFWNVAMGGSQPCL
jgi:ABC-type transporter Mla MlaB component